MSFFDSKASRFYAEQFDVSSFLTDINGLPGVRPLLPTTAMPDAGMQQIPGREGPAQVSLEGLWDDTLVTGLDALMSTLKGLTSGFPVSYLPNQVAGKPAYILDDSLIMAQSYKSAIGTVVEATIALEANGASKRGIILLPLTTRTATVNESSVDSGVTSTPTGLWTVHVTAVTATGGNAQWNVAVDDSADDASFAEIDTFNVGDSAPVGVGRIQSSIRRFARLALTLDASSGSITIVSALAWDANS